MTTAGVNESFLPYKVKVPSTPGTAGKNAYTLTTADFVQPAVGNNVLVSVANSAWMAVQQVVFVEDGGYCLVNAVPSTTSVELKNLGYLGNANPGDTIPSGSLVTAGGFQGPIGPEGPAGAGGIVFGGREEMLSIFYLGLGGRTAANPEDVPGALFDTATTLSKITFGINEPNGDAVPITATAYVSTNDGVSYSAIPGAIASIAAGGRIAQATFADFEVPELGRVVIRCNVGAFAFDVSVTLS